MIEVEQHYDYKAAGRLLGGLSSRVVGNMVRTGIRSQGRSGIWPVRVLSRKTILIPASAINRYLDRHTPRLST